MVQQVETETLFNSFGASKYLDIPFDLFRAYVGHGLICYRLIELEQRFKKEELDRFNTEFLCKNKSTFQG